MLNTFFQLQIIKFKEIFRNQLNFQLKSLYFSPGKAYRYKNVKFIKSEEKLKKENAKI